GKKRKIIIHSDDSDNDENSDDKSLKSGNAESDDDNNFDDCLEDEDYDLLEENLGVPIQRRRFKRLKRMPINASDDEEEEEEDAEATKQDIATGLFNGGDNVNDGRSSSVESDHQVFDLD
ncbi:GSCOCG00012649001-RA-CDS, partial [Cotesia congregata]